MRLALILASLAAMQAGAIAQPGAAPDIVLNAADFRDRVYACWLGKNIGGTLGMPVEGVRETHNYTFFDPVPVEPAANDDLDLQLLWLKALEERGPDIDARVLGDYWLSYVPVDWGEYGVGKRNMRQGIAPPLSGQFRNQWRDSNGAWIRSEIWACVAPGSPAIAARYAWEDACVDHGTAEGVWGEVFMAALESAAFVVKDRDRLLQIGLAYIPGDCEVATAVRCAMDCRAKGLELMAAREAIVEATASTGWFMAPRNVAFTMLGWLYGDDDFGKAICAAVNCGDDTDCTGATLGSLLGILHGTAGIPQRWRAPVGEGIRNVAIGGFQPPANLTELTDRTVSMASRVLTARGASVRISDTAPASLPAISDAQLVDKTVAEGLWARSAYEIPCDLVSLRAVLDLSSDPELRAGGSLRPTLRLTSLVTQPMDVRVTWRLAEGLQADPPTAVVNLPPGGGAEVSTGITVIESRGGLKSCSVEITPLQRYRVGVIRFVLATDLNVRPNDVALARLGAKATSDSELAREPGCTARAVDGVITAEDDFEGERRWHSALSPHPHWIAVELPAQRRLNGVIVHFADPAGHPADFVAEVSQDGQTWERLAEVKGHTDPRQWELSFEARPLKHFRLVISRSASARWPEAAQVSEIELLSAD